MQRYLIRRLLLFLPSLLIASIVVFVVMRALPGNAALIALSGSGESPRRAESLRVLEEELGLDEPLPVQYFRWLGRLVNGEFGGRSLETREPVRTFLFRHLPITMQLVLYTVALSLVTAVPLGLLAALRKDGWIDHLARLFAVAAGAVPGFALALLLLLVLVLVFKWSPPILYRPLWESPWTHIQVMAGPVLLLSLEYGAHIIRVTRAAMLEVLGQEYIRTARSKGLDEWTIVVRHGLPNILVPVTTVVGLQVGGLLSGAVILESIFGVPGVGRALVQAAAARDYPVVQSLSVVLVFLLLSLNLVVDTLYAYFDRRLAHSEGA